MNTEEMREALLQKINDARNAGVESICLRSGELQTKWGLKNKLPPLCDAMRQVFQSGDRIIQLPQDKATGNTKQLNDSGRTFDEQSRGQKYRGGNLEIEYNTKTFRAISK